MSEHKHTPGPWTVDSEGDICTDCDVRWLIACMPSQGDDGLDEAPTLTPEAVSANSSIIAASPEMYDSICELLEFCRHVRPSGGVLAGEAEMLSRAESAIAKATGVPS